MIKIYTCLSCEHYNKFSCPAHPEGIPDEIMKNKKVDEKSCGNGVKYRRKGGGYNVTF